MDSPLGAANYISLIWGVASLGSLGIIVLSHSFFWNHRLRNRKTLPSNIYTAHLKIKSISRTDASAFLHRNAFKSTPNVTRVANASCKT